MSLKGAWTTPIKKCRKLIINPDLTFEFQTYTLKFLAYNYLIVLLIANQDVQWSYPFKGTGLEDRFGYELMEPMILTKFGFWFRFITVIMNTISVATFLEAAHKNRKFLLPCILWNFYTVTAMAENILEIMWSMHVLEVPLFHFVNTFLVGLFMLAFQSKLTLQMIRFYEFLNYIPSATVLNTFTATTNNLFQ